VRGTQRAEVLTKNNGPVPLYSRPSSNRAVVGSAVPRGSVPSPASGGLSLLPGFSYGYGGYGYGGLAGLYDYYGLGFGGLGFGGLGFGGLGYDPLGYGGFGSGYFGADDDTGLFGLGLGSYGSGASRSYGLYDPYATSAAYGTLSSDSSGGSGARPNESGSLRLKVKPEKASVYIDGEYVGSSDQYGGMFHKLRLDPGNHRVEIRAPSYETLIFNVRIDRDHTQTYRGELEKAAR
jgi:hypothetical protein